MIVVITENASIRLDDGDNFTELAVDALGLSVEDVVGVAVSEGAGVVDGDHLWIDIDFLRQRGRGTEDWNGGFASMIDYAAGKGWTDAEGSRVRAHIRWR
ncbi:hypothetical protein [Rhodococcus sp. NPDC127528]|uniref:hypothetical protein n=1 Tax=unclassified Rhodococcus (in: high G+C Gram-positive bacteria) TaxID=192944 RepID=UPI003629AB50